MRPGTWGLVVLVAWGAAIAAPRKPPPAPKPEQAEIQKLDQELSQLQVKQAYVAAIKVARKIYDLQVKVTGKDSPEADRRKQSLATMLQAAGDYAEATKLFTELTQSAEKQHGAESREVLFALQLQTGTYWAQNRLDDLDKAYQRMLAISKKLDGENSLPYAQQLTTYGSALNMKNEYSAAQRVFEQALSIQEKLLKPNDVQLSSTLQILGSLYFQTNQQPKAQAAWDRVVKIAEAQQPPNVMMQAGTIWGVAANYHWGNREDLAKPLMKKALDLYDGEVARLEKDKPDDYMISSMLGMSGYVSQQMGDLAGAEQRFHKAIALDEKRGSYSGWTSMLADLDRQQGKLKEALAIYEKAQAGLSKLSPQSATAYNSTIADLLREMGDYGRAEKLLKDYLANVERMYTKRSPIYGSAELGLANVYMSAGKVAEAERILTDSLELAEKELQNVLKTGTDADHAVYFHKNRYQLSTAINYNLFLSPKSASATRLALTTLLRRKGRALDAAAAALSTIRKKLSPEDKKLLDDLASARAKLAKLEVAGPAATGDPAEYAKEIAALEDEVQKLELKVGQKSAAYRAVSQPIELATIQKRIPRDAKLVELVNFEIFDPKKFWKQGMQATRHFSAYVVGATGDPVLVDLGDAAPIDEAVEKFRKAVSDPDNDRANDLGHDLYKLTMGKLAPALKGASEILIAPDGTLNVVPFAALVDDNKDFLVKKYTFTYLTSGRDLLRLGVKTKAAGGGVIFADPNFDASNAPAPKADGAPASRGRRSADLASLSWPPLPGTGQEAAAVAKTFKGLQLFRGPQATETNVKGVHGPRILHMATHGFFLPDEAPPPAKDGGAAMAPPGAPMAQSGGDENPLLRSGLALAGANKLASGDEDGILTALEASGLDLEGTKLVVLSACETGVGKVTNGDGVYGLRRALVIAGAESLVMSLWQVDDQATKDLMVGYYSRLAQGKPRSSALREIQLELLAKDKYKHPYYWASFLPAGDNSPLKD